MPVRSRFFVMSGIATENISGIIFGMHRRLLGLTSVIAVLTMVFLTSCGVREMEQETIAKDFPVAAIELTPEEKTWLSEHPVITVGSDPMWAPLEFVDENGEFQGIAIDFLDRISESLGVRFEIVKGLTWAETVDGVKNREIDMFSCVTPTASRAEYVSFATSHIAAPVMVFTREDHLYVEDLSELDGRSVAIVKGYAMVEFLKSDHPNIRVVETENMEDALGQLASGKVDAYIDFLLSVTYAIQKQSYGNIKVSGETPYDLKLCLAPRSDWPELLSILEKALNSISEEERNALYRKWRSVEFEHGFDYSILWRVLGIAAVVLAAFVFWNRRLAREVTQRRKAEEQLQLAEERERLLKEMANSANAAKSPEAAMQSALDLICQYTGWPVGHVYALDSDRENILVPTRIWHTSSQEAFDEFKNLTECTDFQSGTGLLGRVLESKKASFIPDIFKNKNFSRAKSLTHTNLQGAFALPVIVQDDVLLVLEFFTEEAQIEEVNVQKIFDFGEEVGRQLGLVIERKRIQTALDEARKIAEDASRSKSDFLANMSHEIRTPMNAVIGMSQLALKTDLNPKQQDYVEKIFRSGQHLLGIINDILDFSKVEAGKLDIEETDFELDKVLENVANLIGEKAAAKNIELLFDVDPNLPNFLVGDPLRLSQVLINYANNATKFTEEGEIVIRAHMVEETDTDILIRFEVEDTGIGLTEDQIALLFQSFQQADTSTTRKFGGTGLGLAISKKLSELMGGAVGVESEHAKGSTFWFTARLGRSKDKKKNYLPEPDLRNRRVLVVDDNPHARMIISELLRSMTFRVDMVASGAEAVASVAQADSSSDPYEVVYLDWMMPGMSGIEAGRRITELDLDNPMPHRIIVTAYGREDVSQEAELAGIDAILLKPVSSSLLFDMTMMVLGGAELNRSSTTVGLISGTIPTAQPDTYLLLVEDNELNQQVANELLSEAGFAPDIAENGEIALGMVQEKEYDIVLMDVQMPVMDGLTATRAIRKLSGFENLPIIAMTAGVMTSDIDECLNAGMNDHVAKPIDPDEMFAALMRWIPDRLKIVETEGETVSSEPPASALISNDSLADVQGLDMKAGLRRVLNKRDSYINLLRKFVAGQEDSPNRIRRALEAQQPQDAEREAHTLKGVAGNIGATILQEAAANVEAAIKAALGTDGLNPMIVEMEEILSELNRAIGVALPEEETTSPESVEVDWIELAEIVTRLESLLADDNTEATDVFMGNAKALQAAFGSGAARMKRALEEYDFETALTELGDAKISSPLNDQE